MKIFKKNEISTLKNIFRKSIKFCKLNTKTFSDNNNNISTKQNISKKFKIDENKFPSIDENLSNLLNEMEKDDSNKDLNNFNEFIVQKDDIIFINNTDKLEFLKNIKLGDLIVLNKKYLAKCLAMNNKINTFVIFDRINIASSDINEIGLISKNEYNLGQKIPLFNDIYNIKGNLIIDKSNNKDDSNNKFLEENLLNINNCSSLSKKFQSRKTIDDILFTGNLILDYLSPLCKGNFSIFSGNSSMGQKNTLINTAANFLTSPINHNENNFLIYVTYSKKDAILLKEKITKYNENKEKENIEIEDFDIKDLKKLKNKSNKESISFSNKKYCIFTLNDNPTNSEYYFLPKIALNYAKNLLHNSEEIFGNKNKMNILFCFDDMSIFALKEKILYDSSLLCQTSNNFFADLFEQSGNWDKYSFSSVAIYEKNKLNIEYEEYVKKYTNNVFSFSDKIVNFEASINQMKKYIPNISLDFSGITNLNITSRYLLSYLFDFKEILHMIFQSHKKQEEIKKLNIQTDPWDNYLYYDSKFFLDFIFNDNFITPEDRFIQLIFLNFIFQNEFLGNFRKDGRYISNKLMNFFKKQERSKKLYQFAEKVIYDKYLPTEKEMEDFERNLEVNFDLFIDECLKKQEFSEIKDDYFKI